MVRLLDQPLLLPAEYNKMSASLASHFRCVRLLCVAGCTMVLRVGRRRVGRGAGGNRWRLLGERKRRWQLR